MITPSEKKQQIIRKSQDQKFKRRSYRTEDTGVKRNETSIFLIQNKNE